ncbi:MAG TPA: efflux RND transporter periplasmic adaptor subunit [Burkholderiales bacterium]|nr:efflux RND transporter periplasmic adaptor subunit [Burkholderiales bacterium]
METPFRRNVTILLALVTAAMMTGCGSKSDATAAAPKADAPKPDAAKAADPAKPADAAKPAAAPAPAAKGLPVKAEPVKVSKVSDDVSAVGSLLAEESVIIRPEIDGRIVGLHFQEGQAVTAGTRLVTIDPTEYEAQLAAQRADLKTEEQRLERTKELHEQHFISKDALDVQVGNVARLKAHVDEADSRVAKTVIRAPFSGTLGLRQVSPGAYVKAGNDIVRLENLSNIKVDFRIPENYLSKVRSNQDIAVTVDAYPGEEFTGRVYAVEPVVDERTRTIAMRGRIPNKNNKLKPGMFVRVSIRLDSRPNAVVVPEQAIWPQGRDSFVFKVVDGKAALTKVEIGNRAPGTVEITKGLVANDVVVTEGQIKLRDGAPVTVMAPPPPAAGNAAPAPAPAKS